MTRPLVCASANNFDEGEVADAEFGVKARDVLVEIVGAGADEGACHDGRDGAGHLVAQDEGGEFPDDITFGKDADGVILVVVYDQAADLLVDHLLDGFRHRGVGMDEGDVRVDQLVVVVRLGHCWTRGFKLAVQGRCWGKDREGCRSRMPASEPCTYICHEG